MSRIGVTPITIPEKVEVFVTIDQIVIKGSKGEQTIKLERGVAVEVTEGKVLVKRKNDQIQTKAYHGLVRSLINNAVIGVSVGYKKTLKLIGTGYRVQLKGRDLSIAVGYSHPVEFKTVEGITLSIDGNDTIHIEGHDKHLVGQIAANIRAIRPPEPYKGKGIRYVDEVVIRKQGKTVAK